MFRRLPRLTFPRWIRWLLVALCFALLGRALLANPAKTWAGVRQLRPLPVLAGLVLVWMGHYLTHALLWTLISRRAGMGITGATAIRIWSDSLLGKYLPGRIWGLAVRVAGCSRAGEPVEKSSLALVMETAITLASTGSISLLVLLRFDPGPATVAALAGALTLVAVALSRPRVISWALATTTRWTGVALRTREKPGPGHLWDLWLLSLVGYALSGAGFFLFLRGLVPVPWSALPYATGALFFAGLAGMLAIIVPSGLGVREGVLTVLLLPLAPPHLAALAAILSRPWIILAELLWLACAKGFGARTNLKERRRRHL